MLVLDFIVNSVLKILRGISVECTECLNEDVKKKKIRTDPVHQGVARDD